MAIYQPSDDSYLLQETLKKFLITKEKNIKIFDMGSGSGILAETCKNLGFNNILTSDIDPEAVNFLKNQNFETIQSDLFDNLYIKGGLNIKGNLVPLQFDLIIFNPPYLPLDKREPRDSRIQTTAGKKGYELIIKFLKQAKSHLLKNGKILLLFSSLSKPDIILKKAKQLGYNHKLLSRKKLFFEELFVYKFY
jgi:release factor glutamine methyltransferase